MRYLTLPLLFALIAAPLAHAQTTIVSFEFYPGLDGVLGTGDDVPIVAPSTFSAQALQITNEFASVGLNFATPPTGDQNEILLASSFSPPAGISPVNLLASVTPGIIAGSFTHPVYSISAWIGIGSGPSPDDIEIFDAAGNSLGLLTNQAGQFVTLTSATPIASFRVSDTTGSSVAAIDDLEFTAMSSGPSLAVTGACPGVAVVDLSNGTAAGVAYVGWSFFTGSWAVPGGSCAGTLVDIVNPTLALVVSLDANGAASIPVNLPGGACGNVHAQGFDLLSCTGTNVVSL